MKNTFLLQNPSSTFDHFLPPPLLIHFYRWPPYLEDFVTGLQIIAYSVMLIEVFSNDLLASNLIIPMAEKVLKLLEMVLGSQEKSEEVQQDNQIVDTAIFLGCKFLGERCTLYDHVGTLASFNSLQIQSCALTSRSLSGATHSRQTPPPDPDIADDPESEAPPPPAAARASTRRHLSLVLFISSEPPIMSATVSSSDTFAVSFTNDPLIPYDEHVAAATMQSTIPVAYVAHIGNPVAFVS
ncbi:hypothetical protein SESBI_17913 [Sesbania bispinosa]|nr:hypothetical protein SESBI_17913 [Sesbania bispinosa]